MTFRMQGNARHSKGKSISSKKKSTCGDLKARRIQNVGSQSFSYILHNLAFCRIKKEQAAAESLATNYI